MVQDATPVLPIPKWFPAQSEQGCAWGAMWLVIKLPPHLLLLACLLCSVSVSSQHQVATCYSVFVILWIAGWARPFKSLLLFPCICFRVNFRTKLAHQASWKENPVSCIFIRIIKFVNYLRKNNQAYSTWIPMYLGTKRYSFGSFGVWT